MLFENFTIFKIVYMLVEEELAREAPIKTSCN